MRIRVRLLVLAAIAVVMLGPAQPAVAIQYGEPDNGAHPYVGGLVFEVDGEQFVGCSGTLIAPTVLLTAAHCYPDEEFRLVGITFAEQFTPGDFIPVTNADFYGNPDWDSADNDIAVVLLPDDPRVGYAELPELYVLDSMAPSAEPGRQDRYLTAVGYGTTGLDRGSGGPPVFDYPQMRMRAETQITNLNNNVVGGLLVQTTAAPGTGGGTCYGDSGGPFFIQGTNIIVATTITGLNKNCGGSDLNLRIDTPEAQNFIAQFL